MSKRYGCLPSQAVANANTFDVFILTRALEYYNRKQHPERYKRADKPDLSLEEMQNILNTVKRK